jgi:formate hydrogenlyase transcriptional activator
VRSKRNAELRGNARRSSGKRVLRPRVRNIHRSLDSNHRRFQYAHTGTLFLYEIGYLPRELQPNLLRVLQEQEYERLGSNRTIGVDVRIVATTNQNLHQMVRKRRFRADLYRPNVFPITLPPLRERPEDQHFVRKCASRMNKDVGQVSEGAVEAWEV